MKALSPQEVGQWLAERSMGISSDGQLRYIDQPSRSLSVEVPSEPSRVIALASWLIPFPEEDLYHGALVFIQSYDIWSDTNNELGVAIMEYLRKGMGATSQLSVRPGNLFDKSELVELRSLWVQPILFGFDAYLVPISADYFVFSSHDGWIQLNVRTEAAAQQLLERLRGWDLRDDTQSGE